LTPGEHDFVVERTASAVTVHQPIGPDTDVGVDVPSAWGAAHATAVGADGTALATVAGTLAGGRFVFRYSGAVGGVRVASYRVMQG
jgi:carotenoid cleavage dioxygenase-like enzyme